MNSGTLTYRMPTFTGLTSHDQTKTLLLGDWNFNHSAAGRHAVDIQVRSGDYFVTLATALDEIATKSESYGIRAELEGIVSDLIYLQDKYTITQSEKRTRISKTEE